MSVLAASEATEAEDAAAGTEGACSFPHGAANSYEWDPACSGGGLGCNADGQHQECRWCGFGPYRECSTAGAVPAPAPPPMTCTAEGADPYGGGGRVECCGSLSECLGNHDGGGRWFYKCLSSCAGTSSPRRRTPAPPVASCTAEGSDPYASGAKVECCGSLSECLGDHGQGGGWFYKCLSSCSGSPSPAPSGGADGWQASGQTVGSGWCQAEVPAQGWDLRGSCSGTTRVKVLSYNLFWWNLFGQRGGNGGSAGKLIRHNGPFDIMGFQECDDVQRVLRDAAMEGTHTSIVAGHATAIAYQKDTWEELASGQQDVAEDNRFQYYGRRGAGWARLRHKTSGKVVFIVNHHGPLQVNTGGKCGGEATAYNLLKVMGLHAQASDAKILLGDLNADTNSATQRALLNHMHRVASDWVDAIFSSCEALSSDNLGNGGSDHDAIEAVFQI